MDSSVVVICAVVGSFVAAIGQLGFAAAAWRLARSHEDRLDDHEVRIRVVEAEVR